MYNPHWRHSFLRSWRAYNPLPLEMATTNSPPENLTRDPIFSEPNSGFKIRERNLWSLHWTNSSSANTSASAEALQTKPNPDLVPLLESSPETEEHYVSSHTMSSLMASASRAERSGQAKRTPLLMSPNTSAMQLINARSQTLNTDGKHDGCCFMLAQLTPLLVRRKRAFQPGSDATTTTRKQTSGRKSGLPVIAGMS